MSESFNIEDYLCLSLLPGLGPLSVLKLLDLFGSAHEVLKAGPEKIGTIAGVNSKQLNGFRLLDDYRRKANEQLLRMEKLGGRIISLADPEYPQLLLQIPDPPVVLYTRGDIRLLQSQCVGVVGSRSATGYGRRVAYSLSENMVSHSITVVSGLALGIDSEAHAGALKGHGKTVGVLGCGLDVVYPKENRDLYEKIISSGLLVSEYPPGTRPDAFRFPARNRIIAGISLGIVVVEAAKKSGSLITAQLALDFDREVLAVPGQIDSYKSDGCHWLLKQGAQLVACGTDIYDALSVPLKAAAEGVNNEAADLSGLDPDAITILECLEAYPMSRDEIAEKTGFSAARMSELFLFLELEGHIEMLPGDMIRRVCL